MKFLKYPLKAIDTLLDRISAVVGAILISQFPAFVSHYLQRLGGHVDEALSNVAGWKSIANRIADGSLDKLLTMGNNASSEFGIEAAGKCAMDIQRLRILEGALEAIQSASFWNKGLVFLRHMDTEIAQATMKTFVPNVPIDLESLLYAAFGMVLGVVLYFLLKLLCRTVFKAIRKKPGEQQEDTGVEQEESE